MGSSPVPNLAGGGWWEDHAEQTRRRAWDERDYYQIDANIFDRDPAQEAPPPQPQQHDYFTVGYANVTSWKKHAGAVQELDTDVIIAVETRMAKEVWMGEVARWQARGYVTVANCATPHRNGVTYGGVAILAKMPGAIGPMDLPQELSESWPGRLAACRYYPPNSKSYCILVGAYAPFPGAQGPAAQENNRKFIDDLFNYLAEIDGCPVLLAADLNRDANHPIIEEVLTGGRWHDLLMTVQGHRVPTTCDIGWDDGGGGRAIDHLIGNATMTADIQDAAVGEEAIVHHYPLTARFTWPSHHKVLTLRDCPRLPPEAHVPMTTESSPTWIWTHRSDEYNLAIEEARVEDATREWMRRWEKLLVDRALWHKATVTKAMQGRWKLLPPAPQFRGRHRNHTEQTDHYLKSLTRLRNLFIEQQRRAAIGQNLTPRQQQEIATRLEHCHHLLPPLPALARDAAAQHDAQREDRIQAEDIVPEPNDDDHHAAQRAQLQQVRRAIKRREEAVKRDRVKRWQEQLHDTRKAGTSKCHAYIRGRKLTSLQKLRTAQGEYVTLPQDLHDTLREAWRHIDTPDNTHTQQELEQLLRDYAHCYHHHEWGDRPITADHIKQALSRTSTTSSPGRGSWSVPDLRSLPRLAHMELATLLSLWDSHGPPRCLAELYVTMIPKEINNPDPMALRPIAVAPLLIRLWTTIKVRSWAAQIAESIPLEQHGGVPGRSVIQLVAEMSVDLEYSKVHDHNMMGISYDFAKFFDSLPPRMIGPILAAAGAPPAWSQRYMQHILNLQYRYRFMDRTTGPAFQKTCGIPQGDAMSVVVALLMLVALTQSLVRVAQGQAEIRMYLDDLTVRSRQLVVLDAVDDEVRRYADRWGIKLSPKSVAFATDSAGRGILPRLNHPIVAEFKWLGTFHNLNSRERPLASDAFKTKVTTTRTRIRRLQWANLPWDLRQYLLASNVVAGLCWYPIGQPVEPTTLRSLELSVFYAMFNTNPKALQKAAREAFWCYLVKGHRMHIAANRAFSLIACFRRMRPTFEEKLQTTWHRSQETGQTIRNGLIDTLKQLCKHIGLDLTHHMELTNGQDPPLHLFSPDDAKTFQHKLRQLWRATQQRHLEQRRPHYAGLQDLGGVDGQQLRRWIAALPPTTTTPTTTGRAGSTATTARLMVCNAHRTAAWTSTHALVAGERRYRAECPNCTTGAHEDLHHVIWTCPCWASLRATTTTYDSLHDLPDPVTRTLLPTPGLSRDQLRRLHLAFTQAVKILDVHTREGAGCMVVQRRRVVGKRHVAEVHVDPPGQPPRYGPIDLGNHGGHVLAETLHQGAPSYLCQNCGMRARRHLHSWFLKNPCGPPVHRRKDLRVCPRGMRDLVCSTTGESYCVCLWCGAADKQRSNLIRRHACWEGPLKTALQTHQVDLGEHIGALCALGEPAHEARLTNGRHVCLICGKSTLRLPFKGPCRAAMPTLYNISVATLRAALEDSIVLFQ